MQLKSVTAYVLFALAAVAVSGGDARADGVVSTTNTIFEEYGGPLHMTVFTPGVDTRADVGDHVNVAAGWEADMVSGASIAIVDAPGSAPDAVSGATSLRDTRHVARANVTLRDDTTSVRAGYIYGTEHDYRSHALDLAARTELFERNTVLELNYSRAFDRVCDVSHPRDQDAVEHRRLPSSVGCFLGGEDLAQRDLSIQSFQGSWSQAWTSVFTTQLVLSAQLVDGFQSNPYRAVWLGRSAAQEHHPEFRARYAAGLNLRFWIKPLRGALQGSVRGYRDTWDIQSLTAELAYEQSIALGMRLRVRGRYYTQTSAAFFSDDYSRAPRGQYFTGDRELSAMRTLTIGARLAWAIPTNEEGYVLGFLDSLDLAFKGDYISYTFDDFHYGPAAIPNRHAIVGTFGLEAVF